MPKGLTTGDIATHLEDVVGQHIDRSTISRVTDAITDDMAAWQSRPLDPVYPVLLVDGIRIKIRDGVGGYRIRVRSVRSPHLGWPRIAG